MLCFKGNGVFFIDYLFLSLQELTDSAIKIFKNIGRARAAKVLGVDLAQFYL